ncbi:unnamed protein product [Scytosiphon promiscuus]
MDPPRRPGSGWLQNADRNNKNQPSLAPTPDRSKVTRTIPLPAELILDRERELAAAAANALRTTLAKEPATAAEKCRPTCTVSVANLPNVGRGIIACGHVFCFSCIHQWTKSANRCPGCRVVVRRIIKTMSTADLVKEEARRQVSMSPLRFHNKKQRKRAQRRAARIKRPVPGVVTKCFRVRPKSLKPTPAQQRAAPHPEAPGGFLHAEAQAERAAARQRREERQEQQRQRQQQQQQARVMQPVQARGALAALAETIRAADAADVTDESDTDDVPAEEVRDETWMDVR